MASFLSNENSRLISAAATSNKVPGDVPSTSQSAERKQMTGSSSTGAARRLKMKLQLPAVVVVLPPTFAKSPPSCSPAQHNRNNNQQKNRKKHVK